MDYFNAFWVGGLICALVQILLDKTKLLPGRVMVLLVCSGAVLSFLGFYQPFTEYAGAGASVPLLGFGNFLRLRCIAFFQKVFCNFVRLTELSFQILLREVRV